MWEALFGTAVNALDRRDQARVDERADRERAQRELDADLARIRAQQAGSSLISPGWFFGAAAVAAVGFAFIAMVRSD